MKEKGNEIIYLNVTDNLSVDVITHKDYEYLISTKDVALGYGVSEENIRRHKEKHLEELIENIHFTKGVSFSNTLEKNLQPHKVFWTKAGIVRLGFFIRSERAKLFRDWAENLILKVDEQKDLFGNRIAQSKEDYKILRQQAYELIVFQHKNNRETAQLLGVSEQSISAWVKEGGWRELRKVNNLTDNPMLRYNTLMDILPDICEIEDKELRLRIVSKLRKGGSL